LRENNQLVNQIFVTIFGNLQLYIKSNFCKTIKSTKQEKITRMRKQLSIAVLVALIGCGVTSAENALKNRMRNLA
jgi:hypothetical protein